ncbi:MAG: hypothetical protein LKJ69_06870 [Lactobacillus sp.]|jgi:ABC-type glycerol-3-phosphate transport system substrate-binding protein|nr:hypothetical protein [Lactobacillus sp.]MCI2033112.1 hypothetical protein [Lactobacillus sp.]
MKKVLVTLVGLVTLVSLAACSNNSKADSESSKSSVAVSKKVTTATSYSAKEPAKSKMGNDKNFALMIEAAQSQVPSLQAQAGDTYQHISIEEGKDDTIVYNFILKDKPAVAIDGDALKPTMAKGLKPMIDQFKSRYPDIKAQINYLNPDKTVAAAITITAADTDQVTD